jgi:hypothetical protein
MHPLVPSVKFPQETYFDVLWATACPKDLCHRLLVVPSIFRRLMPVSLDTSSIMERWMIRKSICPEDTGIVQKQVESGRRAHPSTQVFFEDWVAPQT